MIKKTLLKCMEAFGGLSIRIKLMAAFFTLIIVPLSIFSLATFDKISNQLKDQTLTTETLAFNEAIRSMERYFSNMEIAANLILYDKDIYDITLKNLRLKDYESQLKDYNLIISKFNYLRMTTGIDKISIYLASDFPIAENSNSIFQISSILDDDWYKRLKESQSNRFWYLPSYSASKGNAPNSFLSYFGVFYNNNNYTEVSGILKVDISACRVIQIINSAILTSNSTIYMTDFNNTVLLTGLATPFSDQTINNYINEKLNENQWNRIKINDRFSYVKYKKLADTPWFLITALPEKDIYNLSIKIRNEMLLLMMIISLASYLLAYIVSRSSLNRIIRLTKEVEKVESGNLSIENIKSGHDEIGILINSFGKMMQNLSQLMEEKYKMGQDIKSAELRTLQAQINPHFLYNSLDLINCIAIKNNIPQIVTMVHSLAKFYKISLSRGVDIIPLIDEITHASLYVQIQNMRFSNKIQLEINIDESLYNYSILKIILQPIIENSITHGILETPQSTGKIVISSKLRDNTLILNVEDDGVGMPPEKVQNILSGELSQTSTGYGIKNINDRIKVCYGPGYGLSYTSTVGKGTCVEIKIPATKIREC